MRTQLPWPNTWITAYKSNDSGQSVLGVMLSGREGPLSEVLRGLDQEISEILPNLPDGTSFDMHKSLRVARPLDSFEDEVGARRWLLETINAFVNELAPRLRRLIRE